MYRKYVKTALIIIVIMLLGTTGMVLAKPSVSDTDGVKAGEIYSGDKFVTAQTFNNYGTIKGDLFFGSQHFVSSGRVTGDIIGGGSYVSVPGIVDGSIISGGEFVKISGLVKGNVRVAGKDVTLGGTVKKNVIACGSSVSLNSSIDGSLIACGKDLVIDGSVRGITRIFGSNITLKGTFFGNVFINDVDFDAEHTDFKDTKSSLVVLPGTVVHGILKFRGSSADIQKGAKIKDFQWQKIKDSKGIVKVSRAKDHVWTFVKVLFVTVMLFLIGLLIQKLYPETFNTMTQTTENKVANSLGLGLGAVFSTIPVFIIFVVLLALSILITPAFGLIFGLTTTGLYIVLFYFSTIPVGIWLGNVILKDKSQALLRFFLGLMIFNIVVFCLNLFVTLGIGASVFSAITFIVKLAAILFGSGVLIITIKETYRAVRQG